MQVPFTGLTIACIGGAFSGVGVHDDNLNAEEKVKGMEVRLHLSLTL